MADNNDRIRQAFAAGLLALTVGAAGCSHTMSAVFDAPEHRPMTNDVGATKPTSSETSTAPANSFAEILEAWRDAWGKLFAPREQ